VVPAFRARSLARLDHRAVGDWIAEGHAQFDNVGAGICERQPQKPFGGSQRRIAGREIGGPCPFHRNGAVRRKRREIRDEFIEVVFV